MFSSNARGQILGVLNSDVEGFFGTQSDTYQRDEPPLAHFVARKTVRDRIH